jgi:hypothetical protein
VPPPDLEIGHTTNLFRTRRTRSNTSLIAEMRLGIHPKRRKFCFGSCRQRQRGIPKALETRNDHSRHGRIQIARMGPSERRNSKSESKIFPESRQDSGCGAIQVPRNAAWRFLKLLNSNNRMRLRKFFIKQRAESEFVKL